MFLSPFIKIPCVYLVWHMSFFDSPWLLFINISAVGNHFFPFFSSNWMMFPLKMKATVYKWPWMVCIYFALNFHYMLYIYCPPHIGIYCRCAHVKVKPQPASASICHKLSKTDVILDYCVRREKTLDDAWFFSYELTSSNGGNYLSTHGPFHGPRLSVFNPPTYSDGKAKLLFS